MSARTSLDLCVAAGAAVRYCDACEQPEPQRRYLISTCYLPAIKLLTYLLGVKCTETRQRHTFRCFSYYSKAVPLSLACSLEPTSQAQWSVVSGRGQGRDSGERSERTLDRIAQIKPRNERLDVGSATGQGITPCLLAGETERFKG